MEFKNSYIFLKRNKKEKETNYNKEENVIVVSLTPSFKNLLKKSFDDIVFDGENGKFDIVNSGTFNVKDQNSKFNVCFKYYSVGSNYYLDIIVNISKKQDAINILDIINKILIGKKNVFDEYFISIVSYDYISEHYCNKLFPYLNEFERKLRKILFNVYTLNFNLEYYSATTSEIFQKELKEKSKIIKVDNVSKQDCYIKMGFYSLDYGDIDKLLFTKSITESEERRLQEFLNKNKDLSKLDDLELRKAFNLCSKKTDWERFFESKKIDNNFQQTLNDIRIFRNNIAHCKFISIDQYKKCREILKKTIKSLDVAIRITENKDYISKNIKLHQESFEKIAKMIQETLLSVHKNIDTISQSIVNVSDRLNEIVKPINPFVSNIPNIVLPEIELPKFNIPNYFNLTNNKELTKNVESNEKIE